MTAPLASMTGFARVSGETDGLSWAWELRSVNGRGLDLKLRLPGGFDTLEPGLRQDAGRVLRRGNVSATLTTKRDVPSRLAPDRGLLDELVRLAVELADRIPGAPPPRAEALLGFPGVFRALPSDEAVTPTQATAVQAGFADALRGLAAAREAEGGRLASLLGGQLNEVAALRDRAVAEAADQPAQQRERMLDAVAALLDQRPALPEERIAQEVALLASRSDVREELDRLTSHIEAGRALLREGAAVGRQLDFLVQEFVREVNTLCSKSASVALTATGLRLKAVVEQVREQVQNVE